MKTIKTIKAVSAAILFTAGLVSAQAPVNVESQTPITITVNVEPTATLTVTNTALTKSSANLFRTGVDATSAAATGPTMAGRLAIVTNMYSWDILVGSKHDGKLMNTDVDGDAAPDPKQLACGGPANPAALSLYACMTASATVASCPISSAAGVGTLSSPRRTLNLASSATAPISMAQFVKATEDGTPNVGAKFSGAEVSTAGNAWMLIEANVNCLATNLSPAVGATGNIYSENLTFTLVSGW